jgi:GNAT superfamily N-acetyltransferase
MSNQLRIGPLTFETMLKRMDELLALDGLFYAQFGEIYSPEIWTEKHFLHPLPQKWLLSKIVFDHNDHLIGFWIASSDGKEELRDHRGGIHPVWRGAGIWRLLFERVYDDGKRLGLKCMSHTVIANNHNSVRASQEFGFRMLSGEELECFRVRRLREQDRIEDNRLISPDGHAYYAFQRAIE